MVRIKNGIEGGLMHKKIGFWGFIPLFVGSKTPTSKVGECEGGRWEIDCP